MTNLIEQTEQEVKLPLPAKRPAGLAEGLFVVPADFNDPLPDDILNTFEGPGIILVTRHFGSELVAQDQAVLDYPVTVL